jgi:hypothetical protein
MDNLNYWRMCDDLSVIQCILLILDTDPKTIEDVVESDPKKRPEGYEAVSAAVKNAIRRGRLPANVVREAWECGYGEELSDGAEFGRDGIKTLIYKTEPDWHRTTVALEDLRVWLEKRSVTVGFFFTSASDAPAYLDPGHLHYSPKLAAALEAWEAVTGQKTLTKNCSVKSALTVWLNKNAARFDLIKENGTPNKQAIEEAAKVANWDQKGGAPKTPSEPIHPPKAR